MDVNNSRARLKIKLPSGSEFEAEGSETFVLNQKKEFLTEAAEHKEKELKQSPETHPSDKETKENIWLKLIDFKKGYPTMKIKTSGLEISEAAIIMLSAARSQGTEEITGLKLAKGLKSSGFKSKRIDRELAHYIKEEKISCFGYKRSRSYKINPKGVQDAYLKALEILKENK